MRHENIHRKMFFLLTNIILRIAVQDEQLLAVPFSFAWMDLHFYWDVLGVEDEVGVRARMFS